MNFSVPGKKQDEYRALLEAAPDPTIVSLEDGQIRLVNARAEVLLGLLRGVIIGRKIQDFLPAWVASEATGAPLELHGLRGDGSEIDIEISLSSLATDEGLLIISALRDFTERKKKDDEARKLNARLEQVVAERTLELQAANKALRHSSDDLNQFAYAASHDLQEPLRMVALYGQLFQKQYVDQLSAEAGQALSFMITGSQRMEMLLKDLLAYSQSDSEDGVAEMVDCGIVLDKVILNLQGAITQNSAVVTADSLFPVSAHEGRLIQLFQNLIGNAIKYRGVEKPAIHITAEKRASDYLFVFSDNGIGIRPEYAQQVFGIFKRLHGHKYPGTGIGLAICQRIVEGYGGGIWVEPGAGAGSRFCFTLPRPGFLARGDPTS